MIRNISSARRSRRDIIGRAMIVVAGVSVCAGLAGCQQKADTGNGPDAAPVASTNMRGDDAIATVNGQNITSGQFYDALQHYIPAQVSGFPQNPIPGRACRTGRAA